MASATMSAPPSCGELPFSSGMLRPQPVPAASYEEHLLYGEAARWIHALCPRARRSPRILEVGSRVLHLWPCEEGQSVPVPDFFSLPPDQPMPFADSSIDVVVALEALEHMPPGQRPFFIQQCLRVAFHGVVLSCPNESAETAKAEELALAAYRSGNDEEHPRLREQRLFGLPTEEDLRDILDSMGCAFRVESQAPTDIWLASLLMSEHLSAHAGSPQLIRRLSALWQKQHSSSPAYRNIYVIAKSAEAKAGVARMPQVRQSTSEHEGLTAPGVLDLLAGTAAHTLSDVEQQRRAFEERHRILDHLMHATTHSLSWRCMAPFRALHRFFFARRYSHDDLLPWNDLVFAPQTDGEPGAVWSATGNDPQFLLPCGLPAGWVRLELELAGQVRTRAEIFADTGAGFPPESSLERITWSSMLRDEIFVYMKKPVFGLRLDPTDTPGNFRLVKFRAESIPPLAAFLQALRRKFKLLWDYHCTGRTLLRGLGMLCRGQIGEVFEHIFQGFPDSRRLDASGHREKAAYAEWRKQHALTEGDLQQLRAEAVSLADPPLLSVILPVYNTPEIHLKRAIESVRRQSYPFWELCIADDGSSTKHVAEILNHNAALDSRIKVTRLPKNGGISAASNAALALATGRFIALLDHDDELAEHALSLIAREIIAHPQADMIYSDEDKTEANDSRSTPFFKPDWCPDWFLTCMYTCHLGVYRTALVRQLGGFRSQLDLAQDYDLALRMVAHIQMEERARDAIGAGEEPRIRHVADVLYHWRKAPGSTATGHKAKPKAAQKAVEAVQHYLTLVGRPGKVEPGQYPGLQRVRYAIRGRPKISIVIPSAGKETMSHGRKTTFIGHLVRSIRKRSTYANYEILVIDNDDMSAALRQELDDLDVVRFSYTAPFNLSAKLNLGATKADGDFLLLLNDDMEILSPDWLECMLEHAQWPEVGAVGAKLLFPDGRLQHVGVTILDGKPYHHFYRSPGHEPGYFCSHLLARNYSAVTGACLMVRPEVFHEVGGFDESMPLNFNDIDFCLKIRKTGRRIVYTPYAQLIHYESVSKEGCYPEELDAFVQRWGEEMARDPYYNPHLATDAIDYRIGSVPENDLFKPTLR
ncbi:MAG TPA: glycosyltransferase [Gemmataceae bacterium]|jgi:GT2 family glycosyltransferase|nr:glycosyltransferase [Gemmataceae bacterium]